jgi:hypothetical protein
MEGALKQLDSDPLVDELKAAKLQIGELTMAVEILRKEKEIVLRRPLSGRKSRR